MTADYELPEGTPVEKIRPLCDCGRRSIPDKAVIEGAAWVRAHCQIPPDLVLQSHQCSTCKKYVKVTARDLRLAA